MIEQDQLWLYNEPLNVQSRISQPYREKAASLLNHIHHSPADFFHFFGRAVSVSICSIRCKYIVNDANDVNGVEEVGGQHVLSAGWKNELT